MPSFPRNDKGDSNIGEKLLTIFSHSNSCNGKKYQKSTSELKH